MAKRKKNRKAVLVTSCVMAALIVASSSFAWFTSKDEVTNRLTATADYGVSVVEDFTPPKDMTPGQEVTKTAAAVNTGNVDAFVRVALQNKLTITTYGETADIGKTGTVVYYDKNVNTGAASDNYAYLAYNNLVTPPTISSGAVSGAKLVTLNRTPSVSASGGILTPDEVTTLQAGGKLVVAASNGVPVPNQFVQSGDYIASGVPAGEFNDAGEYLPSETGLYLFRRTVNGTSTGNSVIDNVTDPSNPTTSASTFEYSGYYYVKDTNPGDGTYYALKTKYDTTGTNPKATVYVDAAITEETTGGGYVVKDIDSLELKITETNTAVFGSTDTDKILTYRIGFIGKSDASSQGEPKNIEVDSNAVTTPGDDNKVAFRASTDTTKQKYIEVTYKNGTNYNVKFYVKLASDWADNWSFVDNTNTADTNLIDYFYLKDDLEAGETSPKLIESVTLNPLANQNDFVDLTYDLDVILDSVQVTYDADNNENMDGVKAAWTSEKIDWTDSTGTSATVTNKEITEIDWKKSST